MNNKNCSKFPGLTLSQSVNAHFILLPGLFGTRFPAVFITSLISYNSRLISKCICSVKLFLIHSSCVFFLVLCAVWVIRKILRLISTIIIIIINEKTESGQNKTWLTTYTTNYTNIHTYNKLLYTAIPSRSQRFVMMQREYITSKSITTTYKNNINTEKDKISIVS